MNIDHKAIEHSSNPYAKAFLITLVLLAVLGLATHHMQQIQSLVIVGACLILIDLSVSLWLSIRLYQLGKGNYSLFLLIAGCVLVIGGAAFDMGTTLLKTPSLDQEGNPLIRAMLDSGQSITFVYAHWVIKEILINGTVCILWAAFLRHQPTIVSLAINAQSKNRLEFIKAATGGKHLDWRQYFFAHKLSDLPQAYYVVWLSAVLLMGGWLARWYVGTIWMGWMPYTSTWLIAVICVLIPVPLYLVWLGSQYPIKTTRRKKRRRSLA